MTAIAAGAIISGGLGIYKTIEGANQRADAKELAKSNVFSPMQMPGQVKLATNLAAKNYYNGMPGTAAAQNMIGQNGANAFYNGSQGASSGGDLLDLAARINQGSNVATNNLSMQAANYKANALGGYQNALNNEGQWEGKLYDNNTLQPYLRKAGTAAAMEGAGAMNEFSGLDQVGSAALGYAANKSASNGSKSIKQGDTWYTPDINGSYVANPSSLSAVSGFNVPDTNMAAAMSGSLIKKRGY